MFGLDIMKISIVLVSIGAINWALSMHDMNLVTMIPSKQVRTIVYYLIALAGLYVLIQNLLKKEGFIVVGGNTGTTTENTQGSGAAGTPTVQKASSYKCTCNDGSSQQVMNPAHACKAYKQGSKWVFPKGVQKCDPVYR